jgi:RNA polymerase sigma-70 factor (ECF subfamily)
MTTSRERILSTIRERIVAYAASRIGRDSAEDLAQEALLVLELKYGHLDTLDDLLPVCFQILHFKIRDFRRKTARRGEYDSVSVDGLPLSGNGPDPAELAEREQLLARLAAALERLGERCRELMRMKLEGRTFPEIRKILNVDKINTVYTWDFRCRQELLARMGGAWEIRR